MPGIQEVSQKSEFFESVTSYSIGGGGALLAMLVDISQAAQALAVILGCVIVLIRLIHDAVKLKRFLFDKHQGD